MNAKRKNRNKDKNDPEITAAGEGRDEQVDLEAAADEMVVASGSASDAGQEWREKYLRTLADLDNFRKRTERDREQLRQYATEGLMRDLLPVLDALEMAHAAEGDADSIRAGVKLALDDALRILADRGLEAIEAEGLPFDPRLHEAVGVVPDPEREPNSVYSEERRGYRLKDRVLRPSRVQIVLPMPTPQESVGEEDDEGQD